MKISNIFIGQRAFNTEPLDWSVISTGSNISTNQSDGLLNISSSNSILSSSTHGSTLTAGQFGPNKTGWFDINIELRIDRTNNSAGFDNFYMEIDNQSGSAMHRSSHRIDFSLNSFETIQTNFRTFYMRKDDYFTINFGGVDSSFDISRLQVQVTESLRGY